MAPIVLLLPAYDSVERFVTCVKTLKIAGATDIWVFDSAKSWAVPSVGGMTVVFRGESELRAALGRDATRMVFVSPCFNPPKDFVSVISGKSPEKAYCLAGLQPVNPDASKRLVTVVRYDRSINGVRYARNDSGDQPVRFVTKPGVLLSAKNLLDCVDPIEKTFLSVEKTTLALRDLELVCIDTPEKWARPVRLSVSNHEGRTLTDAERQILQGQPKRTNGLNEEKKVLQNVVVSLTTYRQRFPALRESLSSIFEQTAQPEKICLVLDSCDLPCIDDFIKQCIASDRVELLVGDQSLGPHNKYVHAMRKYPDKAIVTFDDDAHYCENALEELYALHLQHPDCVCARRVHLIRYDKTGVPLPYREWVNQCTTMRRPSFDLFATGVGGVLYPAGVFKWADADLEVMKTFRNDDLFLKKAENDLGVRVVATCTKPDADPRIFRGGAQETALLKLNVNKGNNDSEVARLGLRRLESTRSWHRPFFRVVTPVYKSSRTLKRALGSIASQSFASYVSVVCDDGSPEEYFNENKRTVEALGDKGVFLSNSANLYAGAARNKCLAEATDSVYTLFLDADDKFSYDELFADLYDFIVANDYPDLVILPTFRRDGSSTKNIVYNRIKTIEQVARDRRFVVPWCKCIKSSMVQSFQEGLRRCNDVLQHFLTVDSVSTVTAFHKEAVTYCADSDTTMFGAYGVVNRKQKSAFTSYLSCAKALIEHPWVHEYAARGAADEAEHIIRKSMPQFLSELGRDGLVSLMGIQNRSAK